MTKDEFATRIEGRAKQLVALALAIVGDPALAEELAQEACVRAWDRRATLRDPSGFDAWLFTITRNLCRDWLRGRGRREQSLDALRDRGFEPSGATEGVDEQRLFRAMLASLPERYRAVFGLRYGAEMTPREIAAGLGLNISAVETRLSRARKLLAARMEGVLERAEEGR